MRALVCKKWGSPKDLQVSELPEPEIGPTSVLIDVFAASVNYADLVMIEGRYQTRPSFPFAPGLEAAGVIVKCGVDVKNFKPGDRVMALLDHGGFAELAVAYEDICYAIPTGMDNETAAAFLIAYASSHVALCWQANLDPGENLLVLGSAGGVGLTAVEIGKIMGARVLAAASTSEKLALAKSRGADETINYSEVDLKNVVMDLTEQKGVDVCFDPIGGKYFNSALSSVGWGGRYLHIGFVGGIPEIPANRLLVKHRSAMGSALRFYRNNRPDLLEKSVTSLLDWWGKGLLKIEISQTYKLEEAINALNHLQKRSVTGKVVIRIKQ